MMKFTAVLLSVLCSGLAIAQDSELKAVNPAALYYSGYYPGYYPGFRGYQPGYYNPYARFGYLGYNPLNYNNYNVLARRFRPLAAPLATPAKAASLTEGTQYHFQDQMGNINYGYSNINSAKQEVGNAYTGVAGSYKYVDANGVPQRVDYVADDLGFRITGATNLPVAPVEAPLAKALLPVAPVFDGVAPEPVVDTPEVAAAKAE